MKNQNTVITQSKTFIPFPITYKSPTFVKTHPMNKIYYLSTCDTCKRILKEVEPDDSVVRQDIKKVHITAEALDAIHDIVGGSYEDLMNKRARIYKSEGLKDKDLSEDEIRGWILKEYSMLKRPLAVIDGEVFAGNSKATVADLKVKLSK